MEAIFAVIDAGVHTVYTNIIVDDLGRTIRYELVAVTRKFEEPDTQASALKYRRAIYNGLVSNHLKN